MKKIKAEIKELESKLASDDMVEAITLHPSMSGAPKGAVQFSIAGGGIIAKKDFAKVEELVRQINQIAKFEADAGTEAGGKYVICMDFATMPFSDSPHEYNQRGPHFLTAGGDWSRDSRSAKTFATVEDAVKFGKQNIDEKELKRPANKDDGENGGSAPKGHGGAYVATAETPYKVKAVKAIK